MKKSQALSKLYLAALLSGILFCFSHSCLANDLGLTGADTDKVKRQLGQPIEKIPAVGEPPISRWIYNDRTVYFENNQVIHIVQH